MRNHMPSKENVVMAIEATGIGPIAGQFRCQCIQQYLVLISTVLVYLGQIVA